MHLPNRLGIALLMTLFVAPLGCGKTTVDPQPGEDSSVEASQIDGEWARQWMALMHDQVRDEKFSPPRAARLFAYAGVTIYESARPGMPDFESLAGQLADMPPMPSVEDGRAYDWPVVIAAAMGEMGVFLLEEEASHTRVRELARAQIERREQDGISAAIIERSQAHGKRVAEAIAEWSRSDGFDQRGQHLHTPPEGDWAWVPTAEGMKALEPFWNTLRPFAMPTADACKPPAPTEFSTLAHSPFFDEAWTVYDVSRTMSEEEELIARFWSDDPGLTGTPGGHWIMIASGILESQEADLEQSAEAYALLGVALADAFISCWDEKFRSNLLRPVTYIHRHIDPEWQPLLNTPPFPEYTSGHSNVSTAAATTLTHLFGEIEFVDRTHVGRGLPERRFSSFLEAASEAAVSRLYGGIHYPMGIENGMPQGECVAGKLLERVRTRR